MLKKIGDGGKQHISVFGLQNYYDSETGTHKHGFGLIDIKDRHGHGLKFDNKKVMEMFLERNPRIQFDEKAIFMILDVVGIGGADAVIVEYEGYAYSIYLHELKFMALYDKKTCDFHKGLV